MKRTYDPRKVKRHRSYTVQTLANIYGIKPNTVRQWIKKHDFPVIEGSYPALMHWEEIRKWMTTWQAARRWTCKPNQMSCLKCQGPTEVRDGSFWVELSNGIKITLHGDCVECGKTLNSFSTRARLDADKALFDPNGIMLTAPPKAHTSRSHSPLNTAL